jgi:hypothetical protein
MTFLLICWELQFVLTIWHEDWMILARIYLDARLSFRNESWGIRILKTREAKVAGAPPILQLFWRSRLYERPLWRPWRPHWMHPGLRPLGIEQYEFRAWSA